ncbi:MAG: hypothetical protein E7535_03115 [Ruminococcaceae bacterium]|nr:hypothetical protein [Oscillospiraceae bacterium]
MKKVIIDYKNRILSNVSKAELIYWWILRGLMIYGIVESLIFGDEYLGSNQPLQMFANLMGMFGYEIAQMLPANSRLRLLSPKFQNITALGFFLGSFGGAYLNFYYILPGYDKVLHALGTAEAVYIGYEYIAATQLKFKKTCPHQIANLTALGFGFILSSAWELFEFIFDQFFGGDAQHWNYENALAVAGGDPEKIFHLFPVEDPMRFALMDTMGDIVLNFIGAFIMYWILCIIPYRHKGKNDVNAIIVKYNKENNIEEYSVN